ncbi:hypothetical protein ANN_13448 [Periplaneta americana]|uniref:Uncharacterized protein n=1 Tax=Periplaneta americana TaxID=6978 RepID=A0ABQ8TKW1_PERAM|nr:hypothetical protein ANN_13448 [Periplaneta americana]
MERVKWTDGITNEVVLEREGEERMMLKLIRKRKRNWLCHWLRRNCLLMPTKGLTGRNAEWEQSSRGRRKWNMRKTKKEERFVDNGVCCSSLQFASVPVHAADKIASRRSPLCFEASVPPISLEIRAALRRRFN